MAIIPLVLFIALGLVFITLLVAVNMRSKRKRDRGENPPV